MSESSGKPSDVQKKCDKRGILRLDISKPRNSAGSVEFRNQPELHSEVNVRFLFYVHFIKTDRASKRTLTIWFGACFYPIIYVKCHIANK